MQGAGQKILEFLATPSSIRYKGVKVNKIGLPMLLFEIFTPNAVSSALSKLKKDRYVYYDNNKLSLTKGGEIYYRKRSDKLRFFPSPFGNKAERDMLLIFDIPESHKTEREWFRRQLRAFDYIMIQRSVWVGPSPLPKEFKDYLKKIELVDTIKTFKLAKGYAKK